MSLTHHQIEYFTSKGPDFREVADLPVDPPSTHPVRYIAYYLPQFHPIPENDAWWGQGFTEWTNVTRGLPRFLGHYQPRLPGALGFYDLRNVDIIRQQVDLAKRGGLYGFCFHNYWFSGQTLLDTPLKLFLQNQDIDFRFFVNWANESWTRAWDGSAQSLLIEQKYAEGESAQYAEYLLELFKDRRYITIDGRPLVMIYRPGSIPDASKLVGEWRAFFRSRGAPDPYVIMPQAFDDIDPRVYGMDAAAGFPPHYTGFPAEWMTRSLDFIDHRYKGGAVHYDDLVGRSLANTPDGFTLFPGVCPNWDNEARRPNRGFCFPGSTPGKYARWLAGESAIAAKAANPEERIVFINAWNEWAEGAYLEPDRHYGAAYLLETRRVLDNVQAGRVTSVSDRAPGPLEVGGGSFWQGPQRWARRFRRVAYKRMANPSPKQK